MTLAQVITQFWWAVLSSMVGIVLVINYWDKIKWWWMNTWYAFPLIGKTARLKRDLTKNKDKPGWYNSETTLCSDYKTFVNAASKQEFDRYESYLSKVRETDRKPFPFFLWLLIVALVVVEALGFSYVLAGHAIPGASEATQAYGSMGIAFLLSVLLVVLTHLTGHELYRNGKIKEARRAWVDSGKIGNFSAVSDVTFTKNADDDEQPYYIQEIRRVGKVKPSYVISVGTLIFVLIIAVAATYVRGKELEKQLTTEVSGAQSNYFGVPKDLAETAVAAESKALQEVQQLDREGGWSTFIILAIIFVFLQILGVIFGHLYGFAGKKSKEAYKGLGNGKYHSYDELIRHVEEIIAIAQARLVDLQQKMEEKNSQSGSEGIHTKKTFRDHLLEIALEKDSHSQQHEAIVQSKTQTSPVAVSSAPITPAANETDEVAKLKAELAKQQEIAELKRQIAEAKGEAV